MIFAYLSTLAILVLGQIDKPHILTILLNAGNPLTPFSTKLVSFFLPVFSGLLFVVGIGFLLSQDKKHYLKLLLFSDLTLVSSFFLQRIASEGWIIITICLSISWAFIMNNLANSVSDKFRNPKIQNTLSKLIKVMGLTWPFLITIFYISFSFLWYDSFQYPTLDLAIFDEAVSHLADGEPPASSARGIDHIFQDHFSPILYLYALPYRLWSTPKVLLTIQSLILGMSVFLFWLIAKRKLQLFNALLLTIAYSRFRFPLQVCYAISPP